MREKITKIKAGKNKKAHSSYSDRAYKALVSILSLNILPLLVGIICFIAIYFGSRIFLVHREEKMGPIACFRQQNPRILPLPEQDPIMADVGRLRNISIIFGNAMYSHTERPDQMQAVRAIVDNYATQNPLHIYAETDIQIDIDKGSINRLVKDVFYYNQGR